MASLDAPQASLSKRLASSGNSALGGVGASFQSQLSAIGDTGITALTSRLSTSLTALSTSIAKAGTNADDHSSKLARHRARTHALATEAATTLLASVLLGIGGPKRLVLTALAATTITTAGLRDSEQGALVVLYVAIATVLVWAPVVLFVLFGHRAVARVTDAVGVLRL